MVLAIPAGSNRTAFNHHPNDSNNTHSAMHGGNHGENLYLRNPNVEGTPTCGDIIEAAYNYLLQKQSHFTSRARYSDM